MNSEQKMREALELVRDYVVTMKGRGHEYQIAIDKALAAPASEQVGLTVRELPPLPPIDVGGFDNMPFNYTSRQMLDYGRLCIAAHEAKRNGGAA